MKSTNFLAIAGRGVLLMGGVAVMATSLALAQIGAQGQAQTRQPPKADAAAPSAEAPVDPADRRPRQPAERSAVERPEADRPASAERPTPATLGLTLSGEGDAGLSVSKVEPDSLAAQAGLRASDRIVSVEGRPVRNARMLMAYLSGQDGRRVPVVVERDGRQINVQLITTEARGDGPWLGVFLEQGDDQERGAKVTHVYPAGPAARAGLRSGDVILAANGDQIETSADLIDAIDRLKAGGQVELLVQRRDNQFKLTAKLATRNSFIFHGPRNLEPGQEEQWAQEHDHVDFYDIPEYAMELEAHRRLAEQHERIENLIQQLRGEVQALREELKARR
jgi:S1-C subfamily serine protease